MPKEIKSIRKARKPVIQEVADAAGVSIATVSRVMNGSDGVSPELRERVVKAAHKLNYDLDGKNKAMTLAFVLSNRTLLNPFYPPVLMGAEAYCATYEYGLLYLPLQYSSNIPWQNLHLPKILQRRDAVRGVILAGKYSQNLLTFLTHKGIPFVTLGQCFEGEFEGKYDAVYSDDIGGAYEMTQYLQSLGHRQIWYVSNRRVPWFARRYEGYRRAMEEARLSPLVSDLDSEDGEEIGYLATKSILKKGAPVTAVFAGEDAVARGAYKAIQEGSLRIPDDVSVAGFNDNPEVSVLNPPLTSVRVFKDQIGKQMAELILKRISQPDSEPEEITVPVQLIKRESCRLLFEPSLALRKESFQEAGKAP